MKVKYLSEPLTKGTKVKLLVETENGFDLLRGEVVGVVAHADEKFLYRIEGETNQQKDVVAESYHTNDSLVLFPELNP